MYKYKTQNKCIFVQYIRIFFVRRFLLLFRKSSASAGDITSEDTEDLSAALQDAEICLLKSGELT